MIRLEKDTLTGCKSLEKLEFDTSRLKSIKKSTINKKDNKQVDIIINDKKLENKYFKMMDKNLKIILKKSPKNKT